MKNEKYKYTKQKSFPPRRPVCVVGGEEQKDKDNKKKYETKRVGKFQSAWLKEFDCMGLL